MSEALLEEAVADIVHVRPDTPVEDMLAIFRRDGVLIVDGLADEDTVAALRTELREPLERAASNIRDDAFLGGRTARAGALIAEVPACRPLAMHPVILELMAGIFRGKSKFQVNATQAIAVHPGEGTQALHRDRWVWFALPLADDYECAVNCIWAIDNFTAAAGATRIVPRSLELPDPRDLRGDENGEFVLPDGTMVSSLDAVPAAMSNGSVVIYGGATYHGAGPNETDLPRVGMALSYSAVALRQEENQYLVVPPEIARELPERLQKLVGYELGHATLGFVNGMQSPMTLLKWFAPASAKDHQASGGNTR